jgi:hypothetical protein
LRDTQSWFQKYYAERLALVTTTNVELLFERQQRLRAQQDSTEMSLAHSLNVIFKQQQIHHSVDDICLILVKEDRIYIIDSGQKMFAYFSGSLLPYEGEINTSHKTAIQFYLRTWDEMSRNEKILSVVTNEKTFDVIVPFVPEGELLGVLYFRITPDFSFLTAEITSSFDKVALIFFALILIGLIAIFIVSSRAVSERNNVQEELFLDHEENLEKQICLEKESLFTKRIYHTHHKAEKIMGFIKDDVRKMNSENLNEFKQRVITYSNIISRIIYNMKWYDQDINTIISPMFRTNVNSVIEFIPINCGSIPHELVESELFGYEKGSFTGAGSTKSGLFEIANNGTIFLDEVLELPLSAQVIMLRVIQESEIEKIGRAERMSINVRIITATNKNLAAEVERRTFSWRFVLPIECYPHRRCSTSTAG